MMQAGDSKQGINKSWPIANYCSLHIEKSTGICKRYLLTGVHIYRQPGLDPHITSNLSIEFSMFLWGIASYLVRDH